MRVKLAPAALVLHAPELLDATNLTSVFSLFTTSPFLTTLWPARQTPLVGKMSAPPPKKSGLTLYEDLLSEDILADIQARDAAKQAAANAKKAKDGRVPVAFLVLLICQIYLHTLLSITYVQALQHWRKQKATGEDDKKAWLFSHAQVLVQHFQRTSGTFRTLLRCPQCAVPANSEAAAQLR